MRSRSVDNYLQEENGFLNKAAEKTAEGVTYVSVTIYQRIRWFFSEIMNLLPDILNDKNMSAYQKITKIVATAIQHILAATGLVNISDKASSEWNELIYRYLNNTYVKYLTIGIVVYTVITAMYKWFKAWETRQRRKAERLSKMEQASMVKYISGMLNRKAKRASLFESCKYVYL